MKIAVTGASGFVGINLVSRLMHDGHDVRALDRVRSPHLAAAADFRQADVLEPDSLRAALDGCDAVFHLVAKITLSVEDEVAWRLNTEGVRNTARAALDVGVARFVHCSSIHAFDQYRCPRIDETSPRSEDLSIPVYDRSKWAGEQELLDVIEDGLDAVICNPTGVFGPVDYGLSRVNAVLLNAARGRVPASIEGGFDLVDVRDVAQGLVAAMHRGRTGENYLLGGTFITMHDVIKLAANMAGRRGPAYAFPLRMVKPLVPALEKIGNRLGSDIVSEAAIGAVESQPEVSHDKAASELDYRPRALEESVRDLVAFFVSAGLLDRTRGGRRVA
jgi:dihydroflavonol-4-reductase